MFLAYDGPVNLGNQAWRDEHCLELDISESWIKPKSTTGQNNAGVHSCTAQPTLNPAILSANARRRLVPLMQSCKTLQNVLGMQPKNLNREFLVIKNASMHHVQSTFRGRWPVTRESPHTPVTLRCKDDLYFPPPDSWPPSSRPMAILPPHP